MLLTIHRGTKEIGGSCVEIATAKTHIIIDIGMPLVERDGTEFDFRKYSKSSVKELIDKKILPDVKTLYDSSLSQIDGVIISHAHLDHYGLSNYINKNIPLYLSKSTKKLIDLTSAFTFKPLPITNYRYFENQKSFRIGDIEITPYLADHSAFDSYGFLVKGANKSIFYSGDFRSHGRKYKVFKWFKHNAPKNIDCLLMEGTTLGRPKEKAITEYEIEQMLTEIFKQDKICLIYTSGQNIDRLVSIYKACSKIKKTLAIDFYIANVLKELALTSGTKLPHPSSNYKNLRVFYPYYLSKKIAESGKGTLLYRFKNYKITKEEISREPSKYVMIVRPTMKGDIDKLKNIIGGNFIYSLWDGYLKKNDTKKFVDYIIKDRGFKFHKIHTSGHADITTLKEMLNAANPKLLIPIHTFKPTEYKSVFLNVKVKELSDGEKIEL